MGIQEYYQFIYKPSLLQIRMSEQKRTQISNSVFISTGQCGICSYISVSDMNEEIWVSIIHTSFPAAHINSETRGLKRPWHIRIVSRANIASSLSRLSY